VSLGVRYGVHRVATSLGLNADRLQRRVRGDDAAATAAPVSAAEFVELVIASSEGGVGAAPMPAVMPPVIAPIAPPACVLELRNARGATLRVELVGPGCSRQRTIRISIARSTRCRGWSPTCANSASWSRRSRAGSCSSRANYAGRTSSRLPPMRNLFAPAKMYPTHLSSLASVIANARAEQIPVAPHPRPRRQARSAPARRGDKSVVNSSRRPNF